MPRFSAIAAARRTSSPTIASSSGVRSLERRDVALGISRTCVGPSGLMSLKATRAGLVDDRRVNLAVDDLAEETVHVFWTTAVRAMPCRSRRRSTILGRRRRSRTPRPRRPGRSRFEDQVSAAAKTRQRLRHEAADELQPVGPRKERKRRFVIADLGLSDARSTSAPVRRLRDNQIEGAVDAAEQVGAHERQPVGDTVPRGVAPRDVERRVRISVPVIRARGRSWAIATAMQPLPVQSRQSPAHPPASTARAPLRR